MNRSLLASILLISSWTLGAQVDREASPETRALYKRLDSISLSFRGEQKILLGHQNAFTEGRTWVRMNESTGAPIRSDMKEAVGVHPALHALDFGEIGHWNRDLVVDLLKSVQKKGGVFSLSWHMPSLIDDGRGDGSFYDTTTPVVKHIIPGGRAHQKYKDLLDRLVIFAKSVSDVPIIFRPLHEHTGSWFWWGKRHCTTAEYITLWRFTVDYLRAQGVHNFLYAYSPSHVKSDYLERYPGDDYVDILGVDAYYYDNFVKELWNFGIRGGLGGWKRQVIDLLRIADKRNKIPAITEFGNEGVTIDKFWTDYFGWPLEKAGIQQIVKEKLPVRGVAYIMLWRNAYSNKNHFYAPTPGHEQNGNFRSLMTKRIFQGL